MVKAGKHTLALAARYSPLAASNPRKTEFRPSVYRSPEICRHNDNNRTVDTPPALNTIRAEFCKKYKSKLEENNELRNQEKNSEVQELRTLYRKLRDVVPSLSQTQTKPVTSLDVVLSAIDYIRDLHNMLGEKCPPQPGLPSVTSQSSFTGPNMSLLSGRTPLSQLDNKRPELYTEAIGDEPTEELIDLPTQ